MRFFIDSADVSVVRSLIKSGVFWGVTTNPTILKAGGIERTALPVFAQDVLASGAQELFFQSWGQTAEALVENGTFLSNNNPHIIVKLPCTVSGLEAASKMSQKGIKTCITAVYAAHQALLAASVGAAYVAPYLGRMNDAGRDGHALIASMVNILSKDGVSTRILAASIRSVDDVMTLAQNGVTHVTLSPKIATQLFDEPLTDEATKCFESDAAGLA